MDNSYIAINSAIYETVDTIKYRIISQESFKKNWLSFAQTLGYNVGDFSKFNIGKSDNDYVIYNGDKINNSPLKIKVFNVSFEFLPETIVFDENKANQKITPSSVLTTNFINNNTRIIKGKKTFSFTFSSKTTVSSSHKIANSLKISRTYSIGVPKLFSFNIGASFSAICC